MRLSRRYHPVMTMQVSRLQELRRAAFLTLRDLDKLAGVHYVTIQRLEAGKQLGTFKTIRKLAAALGVAPQEITAP